jgi:hypothetical protein
VTVIEKKNGGLFLLLLTYDVVLDSALNVLSSNLLISLSLLCVGMFLIM